MIIVKIVDNELNIVNTKQNVGEDCIFIPIKDAVATIKAIMNTLQIEVITDK